MTPPLATVRPEDPIQTRFVVDILSGSSAGGINCSLSGRIAIQLSYERDTFGPAMPREPENGVVTSVNVGF